MMEFASFHTTLATLMVLDMQELVDARAIADRDYQAWDSFQADPARWFLKANDQLGGLRQCREPEAQAPRQAMS
jgi:hypothetical protein